MPSPFIFQSQNLNYHEKTPPCTPQELGKPGSNKNYLLNMENGQS